MTHLAPVMKPHAVRIIINSLNVNLNINSTIAINPLYRRVDANRPDGFHYINNI